MTNRDRLTMEEWVLLDPDGEQAALMGGYAPQGVPNAFVEESTELTDVLDVVCDYVVGNLAVGRLADTVGGALDEAVTAYLNGNEPLEATFKGSNQTVSIETKNSIGDREKKFEIILDGGDGEAVAITIKRFRKPESPEEALDLLFSALMGAN